VRIIVVSSQYPPTRSGYSQVAGNLATGFRSRGHEVTVLTEGNGCHRAAKAAFLDSAGRRALKTGGDILQVIGPTPLFTEQVTIAAARLKLPTVYYIHAFAGLATYGRSSLFRFVDSLYLRTYYRRALRTLEHATSSTQDFADSFSLYTGPWTIIPNGVRDPCIDLGKLPGGTEPSTPHERLRLLFVGQLRPYKGVEYLLYALRELIQRGKKVELTVVGDGPDRARLEELVDGLDLRQAVTMAGSLRDEALHAQYLRSDVLVLPSLRGESFGIVLLEARLHGMRLVASDLPGVREVVGQVGGELVQPADPHALAQALMNIAPLAPGARRLDRNIAERYSWDRVVSMYLDLYESILAK